MMSGMRSFVKSKWAVGLLLLLALSFGIFGFKDPFNGVVGGGFMSAGDREVHPRDINRLIDRQLDQMRQEKGKVISRREAGEQGIPAAVLSELTQQTITLAYADKIGVKASASAVADLINNAPVFRDGLGNVDQQAIARYAQNQGLSVPQFQTELQDQLTFDYLQRAAFGGLQAPKIISAPLISYLGEKRTVAVARLTRDSMPAPRTPTDAELTAYYETKKTAFAQPERRRVSVLSYSVEDFIDKVKISDEQLKAAYEKRIKEFSTAETREIVQFTSKDKNAVQQVIDLVKQGKKLEDAVNQVKGVQLATLTVKPNDLKDKSLNDIAFAMPKGEIYERPVTVADLNYGIKVVGITPGVATPLEQVADQLRVEVAKPDAQRAFDKTEETFYDLVSGGSTLEQISTEVGAPVLQMPAVDARGGSASGLPIAFLTKHAKELQGVFKLKVGENSDIIEADGVRAVMRLDEIVPARTPDFAEVKDRVKVLWTSEKELEAAVKVANDVVAAVKGGKSLDEAAKAAKLGVIRPPQPLTRATAGQQLDPKILDAMFTTPAGGVSAPTDSNGEPWVVMVDKIEQVTPATADPQMVKQLDDSLEQSVTRDLFQAFSRGVQAEVKVRQNPKAVQDFLASFTKDAP